MTPPLYPVHAQEMTEMTDWLKRFVVESNRIEGIAVTRQREVDAHRGFIALPAVTVDDLVALVGVIQPNAQLRDKVSVPGVRVSNHIAPPSGPEIRANLEMYLWGTMNGTSPFDTHRRYETLHPFTDGNGRSGRALWLWQMLRDGERSAAMAMQLGFLHSFYYQTLAVSP